MEITSILETLNQHKAKDLLLLDVREKTPLIDNIIICTATSSRHAKSLAESLIKLAKTQHILPIVEGLKMGEWVLFNVESIVTHIMLLEKRKFYQLEELWTS